MILCPERTLAHHQTPAAASELTNRRTKPEPHKYPQERSITNRSGQQCPGEIAAGGPEAPEELPGKEYAKGRTLNRKPHAKTREDAVAM